MFVVCQGRICVDGANGDETKSSQFAQVVGAPTIWIGDTVATMDMTPQDGHGKQANVKRQFECCDG